MTNNQDHHPRWLFPVSLKHDTSSKKARCQPRPPASGTALPTPTRTLPPHHVLPHPHRPRPPFSHLPLVRSTRAGSHHVARVNHQPGWSQCGKVQSISSLCQTSGDYLTIAQRGLSTHSRVLLQLAEFNASNSNLHLTPDLLKNLVECAGKTLEVLRLDFGKEDFGLLNIFRLLLEGCEKLRVFEVCACIYYLNSLIIKGMFSTLSTSGGGFQ